MSGVNVFFDLDGVLAGFVQGVLKKFGREDVSMKSIWWGIQELLQVPPDEFWGSFGYEFWRDLPVLSDGAELLSMTAKCIGEERIGLLTASCGTPGCAEGKIDWVARNFPQYSERLFICGGNPKKTNSTSKYMFASYRKILVDDSDENKRSWGSSGGLPFLLSRPWNKGRDYCRDDGTIYVKTSYVFLRNLIHLAGRKADDPSVPGTEVTTITRGLFSLSVFKLDGVWFCRSGHFPELCEQYAGMSSTDECIADFHARVDKIDKRRGHKQS